MTAKAILQSVTPPFVWKALRGLRRRLLPSTEVFAYTPEGWATPLPEAVGGRGNRAAVIGGERSLCEELIAKSSRGSPSLSLGLGEDLQHLIFGYVLALIARQQRAVTVLDYGGSLGDYYWLGRSMVPDVNLVYHCKELPDMAEAGRRTTPAVTWHTDDACLSDPYDLVMFAGSLQHLPNWEDVVRRASQNARYVFLMDIATVHGTPGFVAIRRWQGVYSLYQILNSADIVRVVEGAGLRLTRTFATGDHLPVERAPEQPTYAGWLFERDPQS